MQIRTVDQLAGLLNFNHRIDDLKPITPRGMNSTTPLQLEAAMASFGDVSLASITGNALTMTVQPNRPRCMVALPSAGWGQYAMDDHKIENSFGCTIAYLPPRAWRLVNDRSGGTAIEFTEEALLARILAMSGDLNPATISPLLSLPFAVSTREMPARSHYHKLLAALGMVDHSYRWDNAAPDPFLRLDDLILRCVAMLLFPQLLQKGSNWAHGEADPALRRSTRELMDWMMANLDQPISLSEIEAEANYGRRAIQQGFKREVGCGPMQWLRRQRLQLARHALQHPRPGLSVGAVARSCGYINLASFSRDFHARYGITAARVLREARQSQGA